MRPRGRGARQYLAAGVRTDLEQCMANFSALSTVRYEDFCVLWKDKKMSFIFCGRDSEMELREFTEECLRIAAEFLMPPYTFQVQVGAIYLLYGLYFKQPNNPRVRIRLTLLMWQHLQEFILELHNQQHLDAEFIFLKLQHAHAFDFVASTTQMLPMNTRSMEVGERDQVEEQRQQLMNLQRTDLADVLNLSEMADIHLKYHQMKLAIAPTGSSKLPTSLSVIGEDIIDNITQTIYRHERWRSEKITGNRSGDPEKLEPESDKPEPDSVGSRRALLKQRAYESAPPEGWRTRRHVQPQPLIEESDPSPSKRSRLQADPEETQQADDSPQSVTLQQEEIIVIENEPSTAQRRGRGRPRKGRGRGRGRGHGKKH